MNTHNKAIEILQWSGYLQDESGQVMWKKYYWTDITKKLLLVLQHSTGGLIGITGLQGIGKTTTLHALSHKLEEDGYTICTFIKWSSKWKENFAASVDWENNVFYDDLIDEALLKDRNLVRRTEDNELLEKYLKKSTVKKLREKALYTELAYGEYILVDFKDYSKESINQMTADLNSFQEAWILLRQKYKTKATFVLAIQQELMEQHAHFLWGKMRLFQLEPLTADNMLELYLRFHKVYEPFTKEALTKLAKLSQGFFRRFMEYINIVVSQYVIDKRTDKITLNDVETLIPVERIISDMELQLVGLFPNDDQRQLATDILKLLQEKQQLSQKQIAVSLNENNTRISRALKKLNNNLTIKQRGKGAEWLISLK